MSKTTQILVLRAAASLPAGTETGGWVRVPANTRIVKTKLNHGAVGGNHLDAKLQWATVPSGVVFDGITYAQDAADGAESAEHDDYLTYVRYVVTATGGTITAVKLSLELTQHPVAPTDYNFDLQVKQVRVDARVQDTGWKRIPKEVLAYLAVLDAAAAANGATTLNVKLQSATDTAGTGAGDVASGAFTQVTNAAAAKEVKGTFIPAKDFVRARGTYNLQTANVNGNISQAAPIEDVIAAAGAGTKIVVVGYSLTFATASGQFFFFCDHAMSGFIDEVHDVVVSAADDTVAYAAHENLGVDLKWIGAGTHNVTGTVDYFIASAWGVRTVAR